MKKSSLLIITLIVAVLTSFIVTTITVNGAKLGGDGISKESTFEANLNPSDYFWKMFPFGLFIGSIIGGVTYGIGYALSPKEK